MDEISGPKHFDRVEVSFKPPRPVAKRFSYEWKPGIGPVFYINVGSRRMGLCVCHHRKDRSVKFFGLENYLCSRDMGISFGYIGGIFLFLLGFSLPFLLALALALPMIIDGGTQSLRWRESNNTLRLFTGFLFGLSVILYMGGAIFGRY